MKAADKKKVTAAWKQAIPVLDVLKPGELVRRHGPILCGLCLDGTSEPEYYKPTVFFHCLADPFSGITLNGAGRLLSPSKHEKVLPAKSTDVEQAAKLMQYLYPSLGEAELDLNAVVQHFARLRQGEYGVESPYMRGHYRVIALSAAAIGLEGYARKTVEFAAHEMESWPPEAFRTFGSMQMWRESMLAKIKEPTVLKQVVDAEVKKHDLSRIRDRTLKVPAQPLGLWEA